MRKYLMGSVLGLSVIAASLVSAKPAHATYWLNYASEGKPTQYYLSFNTVSDGQQAVIHPYNVNPNQIWSNPSDPNHAGGVFFVDAASPPSPQNPTFRLDVYNNNIANGTAIIGYSPNTGANQSWIPIDSFQDQYGATCSAFKSAGSPGSSVYVFGVSGGHINDNQPIILWQYFADKVNHPDQYWCAY